MRYGLFAAIRRASVVLSLLVALSTPLLWGAPARAGTTITQAVPGVCAPAGITITQPGEYTLGENVSCVLSGDGIDIEASGVTLHLNGFTITGTCLDSALNPNSAGIHVMGPSALTPLTMVRILGEGTTISGFQNGIQGDNSAGSFAKSVNITSACPGAVGILISSSSSQWKLQKDTITNVGIGISLSGNDNDLVLNSVSGTNTDTGILVGGMNNTIVNNTASMNGTSSRGIDVIGAGNNDLHANTTDNNFDGIVVESGSSNNNITGNESSNNTRDDMRDENTTPPCDTNKWRGNHFMTANQSCIN